MKKVYLAHPISTTGEFNDSIRVAERIESLDKFNVYAPALNKAINDKSNNPTPQMIYEQDVEQLVEADIIVINYTGGDSDGTVLELGLLGGLMEAAELFRKIELKSRGDANYISGLMADIYSSTRKQLPSDEVENIQEVVVLRLISFYLSSMPTVYAYSSNQRATKPQLYNLVLGKLYESGLYDSLEGFIPSGKLNAMVVGLIEKHFVWCANEDEVIQKLRDYDG